MSRGSSLRSWFTPGLIGLHLFAVAAVIFCIVMGLWQAGVYDSRKDNERADTQEVPRVALTGLWSQGEAFTRELNHRPVTAEGTFAPSEQQVWVTGKEQAGRTGVWLLAPLLTGASDDAILVVRGWAPEVSALPPVPTEPVTVQAVLEPGEAAAARFDPDQRTIGSVRIPELLNVLPYDLYAGYLVSTEGAVSGGLELVPPPQPGDVSWTVGLRNLAYAVQWWVFGAFALFMWWRMSAESVAAKAQTVA